MVNLWCCPSAVIASGGNCSHGLSNRSGYITSHPRLAQLSVDFMCSIAFASVEKTPIVTVFIHLQFGVVSLCSNVHVTTCALTSGSGPSLSLVKPPCEDTTCCECIHNIMVPLERFELPTFPFVADYSVQLSYKGT